MPPVPSSVPSARREVRAWLEALPVDPDTRDDVLVVLSELLTNGVLHNGGEVIAVRASGDPAGVSLEVDTADRTNDEPLLSPYRDLSHPSESGRGLALVSALADSVVTVARMLGMAVRLAILVLGAAGLYTLAAAARVAL